MGIAPGTVWEERTTKGGKKYKIGRPPQNASNNGVTAGDSLINKKPIGGMTPHGDNFGIDVYWERGIQQDAWTNTSSSISDTTKITKYHLYASDDDDTVLDFQCTDTYDYYFTDETFDEYECDCFRTGPHYVSYNSTKPNITHVRGT